MEDAAEAYRVATANGGIGVTEPQKLTEGASGQEMVVSEIQLFGDCLLRFVSGGFQVCAAGCALLSCESTSG